MVAGLTLAVTMAGAAPAQQSATQVQVQAQAPAPAQTPAPAQAPAQQTDVQTQGPAANPAVEGKGPNTGRVSLLFGADWASAYYFRGIVNEQNGGNNAPPYAEIGFKLLKNVGPLSALVLAPGTWNNGHYGGGTAVEASDPKFGYESDPRLTATWWEVFPTGVTYTYCTSPERGISLRTGEHREQAV